MKAYIYQADIYCEDCMKDMPHPEDQSSYDSDEYPKGPFADGGGSADSPQHCGNHGDCVNAITLSDGTKIGVWLENPLTNEGVEYVRDHIAEEPDNEVVKLWAEWYADDLV